ncbi:MULTISPECIES: hypothetical protein [unclassified Mycobacterium]|nr:MULTISPECIES: hypothetical protein [unclassified Mycobacterium]
MATPLALFHPFVDQVEKTELREGTVVVVYGGFGHDLASDGHRAAPDTR